jgi:hypothetical protein
MSDVLKDFDAVKILFWVIPGAFIALFRSFAMRGAFPAISKDDVAALILGSVVYWFLLLLIETSFDVTPQNIQTQFSGWTGFIGLIAIPAILGLLLGFLEAGDGIGQLLRFLGVRLPSPDATAWETMFREMQSGSVLLVTLKDGTTVFGRWVGGKRGSASSTDAKTMDLYLGQIGEINAAGQYVAKTPQRGAYLVATEIRFIEVIAV